jgi:hypothetical protein
VIDLSPPEEAAPLQGSSARERTDRESLEPILLRLGRVGVLAGQRFHVRSKQREADLHGLAASTLADRICFRQMLVLVKRPGRLETMLHKLIRNPDPLEIHLGRDFLGFGESDVADRRVGIDLVDHVIRHAELDVGDSFGQLLFQIGPGRNYRARETVVELHRPEFSSSRTGSGHRLKILQPERAACLHPELAVTLRV